MTVRYALITIVLSMLCACSVLPPEPGSTHNPVGKCDTLDDPDATLQSLRACAREWRNAYRDDEAALRAKKRGLDVAAISLVAASVAAAAYGANNDVITGLGLVGGTMSATSDYLRPAQRAAADRSGVDGMTCVLNASATLASLGERFVKNNEVARNIVPPGPGDEIELVARSFEKAAKGTETRGLAVDRVREAIYRVHMKVVAAYTLGAVDGAALKAALEKAVGLGKAAEAKNQTARTAALASGDDKAAARAALDEADLAREIAEAYVDLESCGVGG